MLKQLLYVSTPDYDLSLNGLSDILVSSNKNNANVDITGYLFCSDGLLFQVLEGPDLNVDHLFTYKISVDKRHSNITNLSESLIEKRSFPNWRMGFDDRLDSFKKIYDTCKEYKVVGLDNLANHYMSVYKDS